MGLFDESLLKFVFKFYFLFLQTVKCKELVKGRHCKYYNKLSHEKDFHRFYQSGEVLDIEDLINVGKSCGVCPYFLAKKASESADIILLPYNYIIDRESRESNSFFLQVIFLTFSFISFLLFLLYLV